LQFYWSGFVLFGLRWARLDHLLHEGLEIVTAETATQAALTGTCPASPALQAGVKGHNVKGNYLTGKPRPLGRGFPMGRDAVNKSMEVSRRALSEHGFPKRASFNLEILS